ncbi:hypothetical protein DEM27_05830 [Metarhizobium album]|uniref:HTH cro/C1-type domain-containing protein n=1 Tax=Metarhizobium album TaxID=2182425 RepID=A0A2U2DV32_9HYPH|nr:helix-turn-helix transcriptional regulator [Rhizobium album]PWE57160.1 hypothetical protein DEM27_05830 [Rhizobium album]
MSITDEEKKLIGKAIAAKRAQAGQTLAVFGGALGITPSAVHYLEAGTTVPSTDTLVKLRREYSLDPLMSIANPDYRVETADNDALREAYLEDNFGTSHRGDAKPSHVHASDAREDDWITQQELHMQSIADNSGSMVEDAIELHAALVAEDDKLYTADGKPLADKATLDASWRREVKAFRILARMQCRTAEEAQVKLRYFLRQAEPDEYSNIEKLTLDAYVDEADKGTGCGDLTADFLQSLLVERV